MSVRSPCRRRVPLGPGGRACADQDDDARGARLQAGRAAVGSQSNRPAAWPVLPSWAATLAAIRTAAPLMRTVGGEQAVGRTAAAVQSPLRQGIRQADFQVRPVGPRPHGGPQQPSGRGGPGGLPGAVLQGLYQVGVSAVRAPASASARSVERMLSI